MTPDEAVTLITNRLGNRGTAFNTEAIAEMQAAQRELEELPEPPWFLLTYNTSLATVAGTRTVSVPSGFLMEDIYSQLWVVDTEGVKHRVTKKDYDTLQGSKHLTESKIPEFFALQNDSLYFFPLPDRVYSLEWFYYTKDPTTIVAGGDTNLWLTHAARAIYTLAGYNLALFMRFNESAAVFYSEHQRALGQLMIRDEARRQAALEAYMGG